MVVAIDDSDWCEPDQAFQRTGWKGISEKTGFLKASNPS